MRCIFVPRLKVTEVSDVESVYACSDLQVERQMGSLELNPAALINIHPARISDRSQPPAKYHSLPLTQTHMHTHAGLSDNRSVAKSRQSAIISYGVS